MNPMKWLAAAGIALMASACAQVASEHRPRSRSAETRCADFMQMANDPATTAYRRAAAQEALRAQRCPGHH
jgi:hypothetical protein